MLILAIWPLFALICLGFALARTGRPAPEFWPAAERINYVLLFPALLISNLAEAPLDDPEIVRLGGAAVTMICVAAAALWGARRLRPSPAARFGAVMQGAIRFNTYLGLAVTASLLGEPGLRRAALVLAVAVPLVNVLSVLALTARGSAPGAGALIRPIVTNPLILACAIGIALALTGIGLPLGVDRLFELLAQASLPLGLLCVGAALRPEALRREVATLAAVSGLRLLAMPLVAVACAALFGLAPTEALVLLVFAAIPTAPTAYVLTRQMHGDGELMAGLVTAQTVAAVLTIPAMIWLLSGLMP
ncbi:AEC family transporter [Palleronia sediminis]|uniref:AEC family transporter n=1 Tax=Palleronia sediminis TaxID=2547833 RepID=A0A4R5ZY66_9RHOB|nr:AEC family transporter [Palleronia sediminis]TDL75225.1 AEC family transporter [Palleronia sediminis]